MAAHLQTGLHVSAPELLMPAIAEQREDLTAGVPKVSLKVVTPQVSLQGL